MGIRVHAPLSIRDANQPEHFYRSFSASFFAKILVNIKHFTNLIAHFEHRVKRRLRLLKDHRNAIPTYMDHLAIRQIQQIGSIKEDLTFFYFARRINQADD